MNLNKNQEVSHPKFGKGIVILDNDETVIVRFEHGLEECEKLSLFIQSSLEEKIERGVWDNPSDVLLHATAHCIRSINDSWGLFSLSRITLLPHQLWVCHQVMKKWPSNYLIADDVGLGKTIEAGLILWPLLTKGLVKRFLILCPASLVSQWQYRMREMFDLRLTIYTNELDKPVTDFWNSYDQVVASIHTMRSDINDRHSRMLDSKDWDLLIIDEAHHINKDERNTTNNYKFIEKLINEGKVKSRIFFSGTPHKGKDFNFLSLLRLLRPDIFDPKISIESQYKRLSEVMIRNNKQSVVNMSGNKLFQKVKVFQETYYYSEEEATFYDKLTEFIVNGKAYASHMDSFRDKRYATLILITLQKLASSSVAAIRKALNNRKLNLLNNTTNSNTIMTKYLEDIELEDYDKISESDEEIASLSINLMENEMVYLDELILYADLIEEETKIIKILEIIDLYFYNRSVLFFTEYKATQSLLFSKLKEKYGRNTVTFINGDEKLIEIKTKNEKSETYSIKKQMASDRFNSGEFRFLISTEAGGEGIDLQRNCHSLIHVDLPWNPMRLHQRVGRVNRYGQKNPVEVISIRNPDTVESKIWDKLNLKIESIMNAFGNVMEEPEDLMQLILGMTDNSMFTELFHESQNVKKETFSTWFDEKTKTFGHQDAILTVKNILGNSLRFDYGELDAIPKKDIEDLKTFFEAMLQKQNRRLLFNKDTNEYSFLTPEKWITGPGFRKKYDNIVFHRTLDKSKSMIGVGHKVFESCLKDALLFNSSIAIVDDLLYPLVIFQISERLTEKTSFIGNILFGLQLKSNLEYNIIEEEQLFNELNRLLHKSKPNHSFKSENQPNLDTIKLYQDVLKYIENFDFKDIPFTIPDYRILVLLIPT
ncbi:MAG: DEAD/DEAH box helicase [Leptospiraceae bacterium]|nr:DEAD/DEAH box helicase [Leptospiraceae bacterium]